MTFTCSFWTVDGSCPIQAFAKSEINFAFSPSLRHCCEDSLTGSCLAQVVHGKVVEHVPVSRSWWYLGSCAVRTWVSALTTKLGKPKASSRSVSMASMEPSMWVSDSNLCSTTCALPHAVLTLSVRKDVTTSGAFTCPKKVMCRVSTSVEKWIKFHPQISCISAKMEVLGTLSQSCKSSSRVPGQNSKTAAPKDGQVWKWDSCPRTENAVLHLLIQIPKAGHDLWLGEAQNAWGRTKAFQLESQTEGNHVRVKSDRDGLSCVDQWSWFNGQSIMVNQCLIRINSNFWYNHVTGERGRHKQGRRDTKKVHSDQDRINGKRTRLWLTNQGVHAVLEKSPIRKLDSVPAHRNFAFWLNQWGFSFEQVLHRLQWTKIHSGDGVLKIQLQGATISGWHRP